jgi:uncharacterized membrane protein YdbT with pleckstrin-like domain
METPQGETLVWKGHPSWRAMLLFYVKWTIIALIPAAIYVALQAAGQDSSVTWLGGATVIALILVYVIGWVLRRTTRYLVTDRRISIRTGLFARNERTMHVERIQNVNMSQNMFQRLLGIGDVDWDTAGTGVADAEFRFRGIDDPSELVRLVDEYHSQQLDPGRTMSGPPAPPSAGA